MELCKILRCLLNTVFVRTIQLASSLGPCLNIMQEVVEFMKERGFSTNMDTNNNIPKSRGPPKA